MLSYDWGVEATTKDSNRNVEREIDLLNKKQYICACLVSVSCTGIKQTCSVTPGSVQLFKKNLPKNHSPLLAVASFFVRLLVLLCIKQTTTRGSQWG